MSNGADQIKRIAIIPAQPGWFVGTFVENGRGGEVCKEPVIAWEITDETMEDDDWSSVIRRAMPITHDPETNNTMLGDYVIYTPDGRITHPSEGDTLDTFENEAEALAYMKQLYMTPKEVLRSRLKVIHSEEDKQ